MDLRKIRQFVAVAEELHFGRAAERLKMAQPPLSQAMRRLEFELGFDLFDRSRRSVSLTEAGQVFLAESRRTIAQADLARALAQRAAVATPELRIGMINSALNRVLPDLVVKYRAALPEVQLHLIEQATVGQIEDVLTGKLDIAFISAPLAIDQSLETMIVERSRSMAVVPADSPLARQDAIELADLAKQPLILPPERYARHHADTMAIFSDIGVVPVAMQEASQVSTTMRLVGAGLGCSIMLEAAQNCAPRNVKFLRILNAPPRQPWELAMAWEPRHQTRFARRFVDLAKEHVAQNPHLLEVSSAAG